MFIRVEMEESNDVNVRADQILTFAAKPDGEGSVITLIGGFAFEVKNSTRSLRSYIKKAFSPEQEQFDPQEA